MATVSAGRSAQPANGRHRKCAVKAEHTPARTERLLAVDTAYLAAFTGSLALALRFPEGAGVLCGLGGVTARAASREAARLAGRLWDLAHHERPSEPETARRSTETADDE